MSAPSPVPAATVLVPFLAAAAILASRARPALREAWTLLAGVATAGLAALLSTATLSGTVHQSTFGQVVTGVPLAVRADAMGALFALLAATLWVVTGVYSVGYLRGLGAADQTRFFAALAASVGATLGVALAANLVTLFVLYEVLTVATYPLVGHDETAEARRAGRTYLAYTLGGGVAVLAGVVLVAATAESSGFVAGGLPGLVDHPVRATAAYALLVAGFGVKAAIVPLHGWLPEAMVAPTPVSALLHAVAVVKSGVFAIARVLLFVFGAGTVTALGLGTPLAVAAAATTLVGGALALRQDRLKRALAYSTVSQLSYVVLGVALLTPTAVFGALFHLVAHAVMKITLFFCAGAIYVETGVDSIPDLGRLGGRLPATFAAFAVASAGLVGLPGVVGFVSKLFLLLGALEAGAPLFAVVLLVAGLLKLLLFWPVVASAYAGREGVADFLPIRGPEGVDDAGHASDVADAGANRSFARPRSAIGGSWLLVGPLLVTALSAVVLGVVPDATPFWDLSRAVATEVFPGG